MSKLEQIQNLDNSYFMNTFGPRFPVAFESGEGCTLYDIDCKAYTDFFSGIAVNLLGYAHPRFTAALHAQIDKLIHTSSLYYIEPQAKLAESLITNSCLDRVFFTNSGAEANEGAIKMARKYFFEKGESRYEIITAKQSFHGRTLATLAATGQSKYHVPFEPLPTGFVMVDYADASAVENAINEKTCAVMVETIQGEGGVILGGKEYLQELEKICKKHGILLILDEVQTGMGRTGHLFSYQNYGIEPDIITLAKALGNGVPIGAFLAKQHVADCFKPGDHGSTYGGNYLACSAGLAVMDELLNTDLLDYVKQIGKYLLSELSKLGEKYPFVLDVRGEGLMIGMQLSEELLPKDICNLALKKGFVVGLAGGNTLRFLPPLIIQKEDIDALIICLDEIFKTL